MKYTVVTDEEPIATACHMYWQTDESGAFVYKLPEIRKITGLTQHKIYVAAMQYTAAFSEETVCMECNQSYEYKDRSDYQNLKEGNNWQCDSCVESIADEEIERKRHTLQQTYTSLSEKGFSPKDMSFETAVKLMALLKHSASEDMAAIRAISENKLDQLSPHPSYTKQILQQLHNEGVIALDPASNMDSITLDDGSIGYDPFSVMWLVPFNHEYASLSEFYLSLDEQLPKLFSLDGGKDLIKELCMLGCLAYLELTLFDQNLPFQPGEKTRLVLEKGLQHFSVSKMYAAIWFAVQNAASYFKEAQVPRRQAANSVISRIDSYIDRALVEKWDVRTYRRRFDLQQSALSRLVFNSLLGTNDGGFTLSLSELMSLADNRVI